MKQVRTYEYSELFQETPDDPDSVLFVLPDEITEELELSIGDKLEAYNRDGWLVIKKVTG